MPGTVHDHAADFSSDTNTDVDDRDLAAEFGYGTDVNDEQDIENLDDCTEDEDNGYDGEGTSEDSATDTESEGYGYETYNSSTDGESADAEEYSSNCSYSNDDSETSDGGSFSTSS